MAGDTRHSMVVGAARLLAEKGLQETSFSEVLKLTGAPRGSIYHHFPDGKDQLVAEAVDLAGAHAVSLLDRAIGRSPGGIAEDFLAMWRLILSASDFGAGCSVVAVTVATDSPSLRDRAAEVFRTWRGRLAELLVDAGVEPAAAAGFAALLIAASEGAVVVCRADRTLEPFDSVAAQLIAQAEALPTGR
ncbi:TetR/AcrR family transcriptional regulator [Frondihabitans australicus]|uniref:TetR family transcriptional regulator n=1 Tax=Frondihabitans australicus TaxID=386892 RepID=A0A495IF44_9MICO|nr:TetR/AcrR family transcriptional regulator [Frondihabitans australicus]RKR74260.1 TetR family transcriptional regulator [Frondihabitans australicus]